MFRPIGRQGCRYQGRALPPVHAAQNRSHTQPSKPQVEVLREPIARKVPQHHFKRALYVSKTPRHDVPCYATVRQALDTACDGDSIYILPGKYELSCAVDKNLEFVGVCAPLDPPSLPL